MYSYPAHLEVLEFLFPEQLDHSDDEVEREAEVTELKDDDNNAEAAHVTGQAKHLRKCNCKMIWNIKNLQTFGDEYYLECGESLE